MGSSLKDCAYERYAVACPRGRLRQDVVAGPCLHLSKLEREVLLRYDNVKCF